MKQMKRIIGMLLSIVLIFGTIPIAADNVSAATTSSYSPYAKIEYSHSPNVSCGTIRYITQVTGGSYFNWNYWPASPFGGYAAPESECGTASISMALSYIGISKTPREILEANNGYTYFNDWGGSTYTSMSASSISTAMSNYINGKGKYSPPVIHLPGYSSAGHYVVVIGQISSNIYQILDPWNQQVTSMTINGTSASYSKSSKNINDRVDQLHQWYNPNAVYNREVPPKGSFDSVIGGESSVTVKGWAFDPDDVNGTVWMHAYIDGNFVREFKANAYRQDVNDVFGCGNYHGFEEKIPYNVTSTETHIVELYALDLTYGAQGINATNLGTKTVTITPDSEPPTISNVRVTDITNTGYTVTCDVSDNTGVTRVQFPAWPDGISEALVWYEASIIGNSASCRIDISNHGNIVNMQYATHIYAHDAAGNVTQGYVSWVYIDATSPVISNVVIEEDAEGYTITCDVEDTSEIDCAMFPTWTSYNGQDDLEGADGSWPDLECHRGTVSNGKATFRVNRSNHNNEYGEYRTDIYIYDIYGNGNMKSVTYTLEKHEHFYTEKITKQPTCTEAGVKTYSCDCGDSYTESVTALGHKYGSWTTVKAATCENAGREKRVCERCSNTETRSIAAKGHAYETVVTAPGCETTGYSIHTCKICGKSYTDSEKVALGHKYGNWTTMKSATCESTGNEKRVCERCSNTETRSVEAKGHAYETVVTAPSCTGKGYSTHICKTCGKSYTDSEKAALGHKYGNWTTVKTATCEVEGSEKRICESCSNTETRTVSAKGHIYETIVTAPSCTATGYSTHTCKTCGKSYTDSEKAALGHKYGSWTTVKAATCEVAGSEKRVCESCSNTETRTVAAKGHAYETMVTAPGCETTGYSTHTCKICGDSYTDSTTDALGHKLGNWTTVKEATCEEGGSEIRSCERCDYEEIQKTAVADHKYKKVTTLPTCEESGYTTYTCKVCGYCYDGDEKEALGHSFTNYISDNNATEDFPGTKTAKCDRCNATDTIPETSEEVPENPESKDVIRLAGSTRYDTGYAVADVLKETLGVDKFEAVVVATGKNFADALAGSYLAVQKNAPIILTSGKADNVAQLHEYIKDNVCENGTVYILGGEAAVPESVEDISGYTVKRLAGSSRYDTNLEILLEAGIPGDEIIVATGKSFADSLSASAAKLPILLVKPNATLDIAQKALLKDMNKIYIVGGEGAVSSEYEAELAAYGTVERVFGSSRYDTSVEIAKAFCGNVNKIVVASGKNFPDGLCGGPLAAALNVPLILTKDNGADAAIQYAKENEVVGGYVLGGAGALTDETVVDVFKLESAQEIK